MTDVFRGVGDPLPHPIDCRRELRSVTLGLSSQFLNGSVIASHSWITFLTNPRRFGLFLGVTKTLSLHPTK